ncbi:alpha/beta hydrolase [Pelomonas sp. APW6]|uniref:Alpha/beta hydrolase n=1 Tax=Roseateles subflavus TaxID=3053353 RepID=A0ABT7LGF7_9BURK|nr:alpha/beta fold hydrolase [Pelomonas sp. APW6]MDL5030735.1 alpha/beta hydrolase [Pelomonas sp. APW6]
MPMTSSAAAPPVYLLPGWLNSDAEHWQSRWERTLGHVRIEQADWEWPRRGDWMARLDEVLLADARLAQTPAVLVAHSLGCQLVAAWAAHSQHTARVRGALLVAPPDTEREDMPPQLHNWRPIRRPRLPFPAIAVVSTDDPYCDPARAGEMAADWGARLVLAGPLGHLNTASGLGDWPEGQALLATLRGASAAG